MAEENRDHDIVLFGATSFVGQILTSYYADRLAGTDVRWAVAGRSKDKLESVLADNEIDVPVMVADATAPDDMDRLAASSDVVISTVGPYGRYGSELVRACAEHGTDYCDLTGEPHWVHEMIDAHHATAVASGARLVHCCGFDSVPSDLGVWFTQQQAIERFAEPCEEIRMRVRSAQGGFSGGTAASMLDVVEQARDDADLRRLLANPYALVPEGERPTIAQRDVTTPEVHHPSGEWLAPFVMAGINTKVVHRSHALLGFPWGTDFRYDEAISTGDGLAGRVKALAAAAGVAAGMGLVAFGPTRSLVARLLPDPGEGPSPEKQEAGGFVLRFSGRTAGGHHLEVEVTGDRDPGYGSTAKMLGEAALSFGDADVGGGSWTPATALMPSFLDRLVDHAGLTFAAVDDRV